MDPPPELGDVWRGIRKAAAARDSGAAFLSPAGRRRIIGPRAARQSKGLGMLSGLLFVRLKAAENALRDGRYDEAYRLATAADIREHRRGAAVLSALTAHFVERARNHFRADRFT